MVHTCSREAGVRAAGVVDGCARRVEFSRAVFEIIGECAEKAETTAGVSRHRVRMI